MTIPKAMVPPQFRNFDALSPCRLASQKDFKSHEIVGLPRPTFLSASEKAEISYDL
jgi:hypothetical protein